MVTTWDGDSLLTGKLFQYILDHLGQLSLPSLWGSLTDYQSVWLGLGRACSFVCAVWEVSLALDVIKYGK